MRAQEAGRSAPPAVAVVVPVHDGAATVDRFHAALARPLDGAGLAWEVWYVDDASTDDTWDRLAALAAADPRVGRLRLAVNAGQTAAVAAGFAAVAADGDADVVVTLDGDLDLDPAAVPRFVDLVVGGADLVLGVRTHRHLPLVERRLPSGLLNGLLRVLAGYRLGDVGCGFIAVDRAVLRRSVAAGDERRAVRPLLARLATAPALVPVAYETSGRRDPVTSARLVGTALDLFAACPAVARRMTVAAGAAALVAVATRRPGRRLVAATGAAALGLAVAGLHRRRVRWRGADLFVVADRRPAEVRPMREG